ncbi:MAG: translesion error-prone DNA polymerase V autoproteolytic subunit [Gammaproteobacteria bacterium]|nr:translesion error-prone DNA polymerase V autoproteolytic subunit [Gammaproteobacteria bacterium]
MKHGGKRTGAGRPSGSGKYSDSTQVMRVPVGMVDRVLSYIQTKGHQLPLYSNKVSAGFPSPADDHIEAQLDLNTHLVKNPTSTFFVRVSGESMKDVGIFPNDILIVDRSIKPIDGKIVIAVVDGELTVKRLKTENGSLFLMPENKDFKPIAIKELQEVSIWGVVTNVIHAL